MAVRASAPTPSLAARAVWSSHADRGAGCSVGTPDSGASLAPRTVIRPATALTRRRRLAAPAPRRAPRRAGSVVTSAQGSGFWNNPYVKRWAPGGDAERDAENAARRAANQWARLESDAARSREDAEAAAAVADAADRRAVDAEAQASVWERRAREVRSDLERAQSELAALRRVANEARRPENVESDAARQRATAEAEATRERLRDLERRAGAAASDAAERLDQARKEAARARADAGERIKAAEKYTHELER